MKSILKNPEKIGNEMPETLNKGIEEIQNLMNSNIVEVYKLAKRITYDFDLLKKDDRINNFNETCHNKISYFE